MKKSNQKSVEEFILEANKKYHIDLDEKKLADIELKASEKLFLSTQKSSRFNPNYIKTKDISELKSWIGIPDKLFDNYSRCKKNYVPNWMPGGLSGTGKSSKIALEKTIKELSPSDENKIMQVTKDYLYSDSRPISYYKYLIEKYWKDFQIPIWWFKRIYVSSGSTLEIEPGNNGVLLAYSIKIEEGGKVIMRNSMTLDVAIVEKI